MPKQYLGQLLEELLADLSEKNKNLVLVVLLLETGVIKKY
jgi:hypothetical protein